MEVPSPWNYLALAVLVVLFFAPAISQMLKRRPVPDEPVGTPYKIYTTEFDRSLSADVLPDQLMSLSPDHGKGFLAKDQSEWNAAVETANSHFAELTSLAVGSPFDALAFQDTAIMMLVDQSGSMKGKAMPWVAAAVKHLEDQLRSAGAVTAIVGYTTAGWHGGFSRKKWITAGKPSRPGRLAALLHINYKSFDNNDLSDYSWRQMLNPDVLRENVDGESIMWAEGELLQRSEKRLILLVLSDGAPVDDSTLMENGPSFLHRHIKDVIARIEEENRIELSALGINQRVDKYYCHSSTISTASELCAAASKLVTLGSAN
jgi:cobaltochelatase CobT